MKNFRENKNKIKNGKKSMQRSIFIPLTAILTFSLSGCDFSLDRLFPISSEEKNSSTNNSSSNDKESSVSSNSSSESSISSESSSSSEELEEKYDEISFYFISAGNGKESLYNGDSIYIKAGENDILIDAGPSASSASNIKNVIDEHCDDGKLEYVIATHAHADHIPGFYGTSSVPGIFKSYQIGTIIDFPKTNATTVTYSNYLSARDEAVSKGATHYTALDCWNENSGASKTYTLGEGLSMDILYQKYYENSTSNENNYSVCLLFRQGEKKMLFTGDLEDDGITSLIERNSIGNVDLYKGGHHGSFNANSDSLLSVIQPETICTCCVAGSTQYTTKADHTMPYQETIDVWSRYTDDVYLTNWAANTQPNTGGELNGTINVNYAKSGLKTVIGSNNSLKLKDTEWLKQNRQIPSFWK